MGASAQRHNHAVRRGWAGSPAGGGGGRRLSGSLFFVSVVPESYLNAGHNAFGEVVDGREVVSRICAVPVDENKVPKQPVTINKVTVFSVGNPPPLPAPMRYRPPIPVPEIREQELPN